MAPAGTPIAPGITAHWIIPVRGAGPRDDATDGFVTHQNAGIPDATSELVMPFFGHSVQGHPLATEEVRRILLKHAREVCKSFKIA